MEKLRQGEVKSPTKVTQLMRVVNCMFIFGLGSLCARNRAKCFIFLEPYNKPNMVGVIATPPLMQEGTSM